MDKIRKIFIVVAGGNPKAQKHFEDTIKRKRTLREVRQSLPASEIENLENIYHDAAFIVWGSVPGKMNEPRWEKMDVGDIVLIYNKGFIKFIGEVAAKVRNRELARYFWRETEERKTWELMYFIVNDEKINVPIEEINKLFGFKERYIPRGFNMVNEKAVIDSMKKYGDIRGALKTLEKGQRLIQIPEKQNIIYEAEEKIKHITTEHDEIQWRLIHLGGLAKCDIWVPKNDQTHQYEGRRFKDFVLPEFHQTLDVPLTIKNIDVVWKFGPYSIKSAFEIEHSTQVYSGILRLSDLRAANPNSNYPLFIVAPEERKRKVFDELRRPTFSSPCLRLNEVIKFLGYKIIREIDKSMEGQNEFDSNILFSAGEKIV